MQKRKIEDNKIWEAYNRIMLGESLSGVANSDGINLNKATLRKYIELVVIPAISEEEKEKFQQLMNGNFRGNSTENKRQNRNGKRKRAEEEINKSDEMRILAEYGVTPEQIEDLYKRLRADKHTTVSRDTYIIKCVEHIGSLRELGFTTEEAFVFFMRRPKLFTGSTNKIVETFNTLVGKSGSTQIAAQKLSEDPWVDLRMKADKKRVVPQENERDEK